VKPRPVDEVRLTFLSGPPLGVCKDPEPIQTGSQIKSLSLPLPPLTGPINYLAPARVNQKAEGI
ncbi:Catalase-peroxidase, partial [Clarias magur]